MNKLLFTGIVMTIFMMMFSSCQYKYIVEPAVVPPDPEVPISFSTEIQPIWNTQNCIGCHNTNGQKPNLTEGNSYSSIMGMGLVENEDPTASKIYFYALPDGDHVAKYTSNQAALISLWIEQGALDN